jgi:hypothetical protein
VLAASCTPRAAAEPNPFRAWADFVTTPQRVYRGPTVPFPQVPRPVGLALRECSELLPLCVHAARGTGAPRMQRALAALEQAFMELEADGWPLPYPDAGRGGSSDFDLYLVDGAQRSASAAADDELPFGALDAAVTFALLDGSLPDDALPRCALDALAQAGLHASDPAETESARRAFAAFATHRLHDEFGCDDALAEAQRAPQLGLLRGDRRQEATAALLLAMLSRRHDGGSGRFVRGAWELARQRSAKASALHARPTVWEALSAALDRAGESLDRAAEELAVARYFDARGSGPLPRLPAPAGLAARWGPPLAKLPEHVPAQEPGLGTYGSAYLRLDTAGAGAQLKVWLRGEPGVRWALTAVRLDAGGRELGRVSAPPRRVPDSFLPVELDEGTHELLIVVTKLPMAHVPALPPDEDTHYFKLILDR